MCVKGQGHTKYLYYCMVISVYAFFSKCFFVNAHVRRPISDDPLLFSDIHFVKLDPLQTEQQELACASRYRNTVPNFASSVNTTQVQRMVSLVSASISLPVLDTIQTNQCQSVIPKTQYGSKLYSSSRKGTFLICHIRIFS